MKYYSDVTKKFYNTPNECEKDEAIMLDAQAKEKMEKEKKAAERKARAAEVESARKAMAMAQKKYRETLEAFVKDYGTYHLSLTDEDAKNAIPSLFDVFNLFNF